MFTDASDRRLDASRSFLHIMAESLTDWEKSQIKAIDKLIQKSELRYLAFDREQLLFNSITNLTLEQRISRVSQRLQCFATDLYSVLDQLCHLCYYHYRNESTFSTNQSNIKFPHQELMRSDDPEIDSILQDENSQLVERHFNINLQPNDFDQATKKRYDRFKEIIEKCQVVTKVVALVDGKKQRAPQNQQPKPSDEAEKLNTLYYLRNNTVQGREWIHTDVRNNPPGYVITYPSVGSDGLKTEALVAIVPSLRKFVIDTRDELLKIAFSGQIPEYNRKTVSCGFNDGVSIDGKMHSWKEFDVMCGIYNEDDSKLWLWTVSTL